MEDLITTKNVKKVLFVGEGNFSFSTGLTDMWQKELEARVTGNDRDDKVFSLSNVYSTCYENQPVSELSKKNVEYLNQRGVKVLLGIDATTNVKQNTITGTKTTKGKVCVNRRCAYENTSISNLLQTLWH